MKLLIGITSSIAAYRMPNLISMLIKKDYTIRTILTERAEAFVTAQALSVMSQHHAYVDRDEWGNTERVWHIELAKWCDVMLLAPLSANTLAKLAHGLCDNLLTSTVRALNKKPLILVPAMNTAMWENPLTEEHLKAVRRIYDARVISPVSKRLADGDTGIGGLAEDEMIIKYLDELNKNKK
ncbi:MAG: phosphopantothenoylcysteine decarboxylase [Caldithrix sp.]|nr:phosphopantothenoylcysteine decarboxylase [Caldithrix sp.]